MKFYIGGRSTTGAWTIGEAAERHADPAGHCDRCTADRRPDLPGAAGHQRHHHHDAHPLRQRCPGAHGQRHHLAAHHRRQGGDRGRWCPRRGRFVKSATTGLHFDNFQVKPSTYPRAADSKGSNTGDYMNDPTLGVTGAFSGDTAARFDGVNEYMQAPGRQASPSVPRTARWRCGSRPPAPARRCCSATARLATNQEFGLWLNAGGATMTAWGQRRRQDVHPRVRGQRRQLAPGRQDLQRHPDPAVRRRRPAHRAGCHPVDDDGLLPGSSSGRS